MQYNGLARPENALIPDSSVELSNCFASTFALLEDFDVLAYNVKTFAAETGTLKLFDVGVLDPIHILGDFTVEWE